MQWERQRSRTKGAYRHTKGYMVFLWEELDAQTPFHPSSKMYLTGGIWSDRNVKRKLL